MSGGKRPAHWREALVFVGMGTELVLFTVIGGFGGAWLDREWDTDPWVMVGGIFLGALIGFLHFFRVARRFF